MYIVYIYIIIYICIGDKYIISNRYYRCDFLKIRKNGTSIPVVIH